MPWRRAFFVLAFLAVAVVVSERAAQAQTLGASTYKYPERIAADGTDLNTTGSRPQNLTPLGVSYDDCIQNQQLKFEIAVSGFTGGTDIQIWASRNGDCSQDGNRGNGGVATCWPLPGGIASVNQPAQNTLPFTVRVQDIVGPQNLSPSPTAYQPQGPEACTKQLSFSSQTFSIYFVPIQGGNHAVGTAYAYQLPVDLTGPPAPGGVGDQVGDTLFTLTWTPNGDTDTQGYDVFIDPIPGQEDAGSGADSAAASPEPVLVCPEASVPATGDDASDAGDDGTADATPDATVDAASTGPTDAGCHYLNMGGPPTMSKCGDPILQRSIVQDAGTQAATGDDSGEGGSSSSGSGGGGISTIPPQHLVGASGAGLTVSDKSVGTYTMTGLKNWVTYNVVVSAVDAFGNIGPPSVEACDYPQPVNDFWTDYRNDGGQAGGGFCALEAVGASPGTSLAGVGALIGAVGVVRRRRRSRRAQ
jgi:hypothetical protein